MNDGTRGMPSTPCSMNAKGVLTKLFVGDRKSRGGELMNFSAFIDKLIQTTVVAVLYQYTVSSRRTVSTTEICADPGRTIE